MDHSNDDPKELARKIEQATRVMSGVSDATTYSRLVSWIDELQQGLLQRRQASRLRNQIRARAQEIWDSNGRPAGRDDEFWLKAEAEIKLQQSGGC
jgi:hypothetical protein